MWPFKVNMDSRFRGNEGLASGHTSVFLVYRQEPHGPRPAAGYWLCGHAMPRVRLNLLCGSLILIVIASEARRSRF